MEETPAYLTCTRCKLLKSVSEFNFRSSRWPPFEYECRPCKNEKYLKRKAQGKVVMPAYAVKRRLKGRKLQRRRKKGSRTNLPPKLRALIVYLIIASKLSLWSIAERTKVHYDTVQRLYKAVRSNMVGWKRKRVWPRPGLIRRTQFDTIRLRKLAKKLPKLNSTSELDLFIPKVLGDFVEENSIIEYPVLSESRALKEYILKKMKKEEAIAAKYKRKRRLALRRHKRELAKWKKLYARMGEAAGKGPTKRLGPDTKPAPLPLKWGCVVVKGETTELDKGDLRE